MDHKQACSGPCGMKFFNEKTELMHISTRGSHLGCSLLSNNQSLNQQMVACLICVARSVEENEKQHLNPQMFGDLPHESILVKPFFSVSQ